MNPDNQWPLFMGCEPRRMSEACPKIERIRPSKVKENLRTRILGQSALYFRMLPSTNDVAKELALRGVNEGTVVVAETQTAGRGRFKREWASPEDGLWLSIVLKPNVQLSQVSKLTLLASVAVAKTFNRLYGLKSEIKWPNDVLINQKKVCGILTESQIMGKTLRFAILGIGINANFNIAVFPTHLKESATTLRKELGRKIEREILLCEILAETEFYYGLLRRGRFDIILDDWRKLASILGSHVEIDTNRRRIQGRAIDVDDEGALIVRLEDNGLLRVVSGDIVKVVPKT